MESLKREISVLYCDARNHTEVLKMKAPSA